MPRSTPHPHSHAANPRYVLRRQMQIDGKWRLPGDEVPEAKGWRNLYSYLDLGWIEALDDDEDDVPTMSASRPKISVPPQPLSPPDLPSITEEIPTVTEENKASEESKPKAKPHTAEKK